MTKKTDAIRPLRLLAVENSNGYGGAVFSLLENLRLLSRMDYEITVLHRLDDHRFEQFDAYAERKYIPLWRHGNQKIDDMLKRSNISLAIDVIRVSVIGKV